MRPSARSAAIAFRSAGLPSMYETVMSGGVAHPNIASHSASEREAQSHSHMAGIQRALEVWTSRSRSSLKSPKTPNANTRLAINDGIDEITPKNTLPEG